MGLPQAVNAKSLRRTRKTEIARTEGTVNENGNESESERKIVTAVVTTATRKRKGTGIVTATATVNGRETETMMVEEGSIIVEMITTTATGPQGTTRTANTDIDRRNTTRITTGTSGGGTASIGTKTVKRKVGVRGNV